MLIKRIKKRGATTVVEAHAEVLFTATGDVGRWTNRFSQRVRAFTAEAAPSNKRPRWGHYGKPLKSTFTASTTYQPSRLQVYSAVGSTAPYSAYVDQGTGIYVGRSAWQAKVLPPWTRNSPSLYESSWHPPGQRAGHRVMIKGQKGQGFFETGLKRGFASMRMRAFQVPSDPRMDKALLGVPSTTGVSGATPGGSAFRASLTEWREWRDRAFRSGKVLGQGYVRERYRREYRDVARTLRKAARREEALRLRRAASAERSRQYRERQRAAKSHSKPKPDKAAQDRRKKDLRAERNRFLAAMLKKYGASNVETGSLEFRDGYYYVTVRYKDDRGRSVFKEVRGKSTLG